MAKTLNFTRAAEELHVAQSALSRQIRDLEVELGFDLFERNRLRVQLTEAGREFHRSTEKLLTQLAINVTRAREVSGGRMGSLVVASEWRLPMGLIPKTVRHFRQKNPNVEVSFMDMPVFDQVSKLRTGTIHLGFVPDDILGERGDIGTLEVLTSDLYAVLPSQHPLAAKARVPLREMAKERWINIQEGARDDFETFLKLACRDSGFVPKIARSTYALSGVFSLISAGEGVCLLPDVVLSGGFAGVKAVPTDCEPMRITAIWLKTKKNPMRDRFLEALKQGLKEKDD